jgi:hypothetical protein
LKLLLALTPHCLYYTLPKLFSVDNIRFHSIIQYSTALCNLKKMPRKIN